MALLQKWGLMQKWHGLCLSIMPNPQRVRRRHPLVVAVGGDQAAMARAATINNAHSLATRRPVGGNGQCLCQETLGEFECLLAGQSGYM